MNMINCRAAISKSRQRKVKINLKEKEKKNIKCSYRINRIL